MVKKRSQRHKGSVSIDSTILLFGLLTAGLDQSVLDNAVKLALRGPEFIRDAVKTLLETQEIDVSTLMQGQPNTSTSQSEVREFCRAFPEKRR